MELNLVLNEQAYLNNSANGNWKDIAYTAKGTVNGLPCQIWWENINPCVFNSQMNHIVKFIFIFIRYAIKFSKLAH